MNTALFSVFLGLGRLSIALLLWVGTAEAQTPGNYRTPEGAVYYLNGAGHMCIFRDQESFGRSSNTSYVDIACSGLIGVILDGYCEGLTGDPLPSKALCLLTPEDRAAMNANKSKAEKEAEKERAKQAKIDAQVEAEAAKAAKIARAQALAVQAVEDERAAKIAEQNRIREEAVAREAERVARIAALLAAEDCRYFVATDRFFPTAYDAGFKNLSLWLVDENRHWGGGDVAFWDDRTRIAQRLESDPNSVQTPTSVVSDWIEMKPAGQQPPLFSFYGFHRWTTYHFSYFKVKKIDPTTFKNFAPSKLVPSFTGRQEVATRVAKYQDYKLQYQVLRLCSANPDLLFPVKKWVLPTRK